MPDADPRPDSPFDCAPRMPASDAATLAAIEARVLRETEEPHGHLPAWIEHPPAARDSGLFPRGDLRASGARPVPVDCLASVVREVARERGRDGLDLLHELVEAARKELNAERRELDLDVLATAARNARALVSNARVDAMSDELAAADTAAWDAITELAEAADRERVRLRKLREGR